MRALLVLILCVFPTIANAEGWRVAKIYDGDTLAVTQPNMPWVVIRLSGIDAPEEDQPYGAESRKVLEDLLSGCSLVTFSPVDGDHYSRTVAYVNACGRDLGQHMVKRGAAWVYTKYNRDTALPALQDKAKEARLGLWGQGDAVPPWKWRKKRLGEH